jgi:hypothetical protein
LRLGPERTHPEDGNRGASQDGCSVDEDDLGVSRAVESLGEVGTTVEDGARVDVALVGDLAGVDARAARASPGRAASCEARPRT